MSRCRSLMTTRFGANRSSRRRPRAKRVIQNRLVVVCVAVCSSGYLAQPSTAQPVPVHRQPAPVIIGQAESPPTRLAAEDSVLCNRIGDGYSCQVSPQRCVHSVAPEVGTLGVCGGEGGIRAERDESRAKPEASPNRHDRARAREWRRGWDSNPRAGYPTTRFRGAPVTTTSVPLR